MLVDHVERFDLTHPAHDLHRRTSMIDQLTDLLAHVLRYVRIFGDQVRVTDGQGEIVGQVVFERAGRQTYAFHARLVSQTRRIYVKPIFEHLPHFGIYTPCGKGIVVRLLADLSTDLRRLPVVLTLTWVPPTSTWPACAGWSDRRNSTTIGEVR